MQRAIFTTDGFLFLELLDGSGDFSDGDLTYRGSRLLQLHGARLIDDVDACPELADIVAELRADMLVNC